MALQIVQAAIQPEITVMELAALAEKDPAFTGRILAIANSSSYGMQRKVLDVRHAANLMGIRGIRNLALSLSVSDMAPLGPAGEALLAISLRRAVAARLVAERCAIKAPEEHFTAGLLLEVAVLSRARTDLAGASETARAPAVTRPVRERAAGLAPHPEAGADLARSWHLSEELVLAIQHHHDGVAPAEAFPKVAWVAERVAAVFEGGDHAQNRAIALEALAGLGVRGDAAEAVLEELPAALSEAAAVFQRSLGKQPDLGTLLREANSSLVDLNSSYQDLVRTLEALVIEKESLAGSLREANERLEHLAATDSLTGLLNRRAFHDAFNRDLARAERSGSPLALLMIDVDHFKAVNDTHGHQAGDDVLKAVAGALAATVREGDVVGRHGGEEFVVLLPGALPPDCVTVAERLRGAIARVQFDGVAGSFGVTASVGAVSVAGARMSADEMLRHADEAMYAAKRAGRNRVSLAEVP